MRLQIWLVLVRFLLLTTDPTSTRLTKFINIQRFCLCITSFLILCPRSLLVAFYLSNNLSYCHTHTHKTKATRSEGKLINLVFKQKNVQFFVFVTAHSLCVPYNAVTRWLRTNSICFGFYWKSCRLPNYVKQKRSAIECLLLVIRNVYYITI